MKINKKLRYTLFTLVALTFAVVFTVVFLWDKLPYQSLLSRQAKSLLEQQGFVVNAITVDSFSKKSAEISNIDFGTDEHLLVSKISAEYDLQQLIEEQKIEEIAIDGIKLSVYKQEQKLQLGGFENMKTEPTQAQLNFAELFAKLPPHISISNSQLNFTGTKIPFALDFADNNLSFVSKQISTKQVQLSEVAVEVKYNPMSQNITGAAKVKKINIPSESFAIPTLQLSSDFFLDSGLLMGKARIFSADKAWNAVLNLKIPTNNPSTGEVAIESAKLPYAGGVISASTPFVALAMNKPINAKINLSNVNLNDLMQQISDGKISGTGRISGTIPLKYYPDGRIEFGAGELKTAAAGVISIAPELLAGDNEQLQIARTALENFNYTILKIGVSSDKGKLTLNLNLQGNNPQAFDGKAIKLNVNLSGDVLPLIQQSIMPINDIKQLLKGAE